MTDDKTAVSDVDSASTHSLLRAEHHIIRRTFWQTILSVVGVVIAVLALYAAPTESAAVRQQTAAAVSLAFTNAGVGPARMQDVRLSIDGNTTRNWAELVASVDGDTGASINRNFISGRVLRPDETVIIFSTQDADCAPRKLLRCLAGELVLL